MFMGCVCTLTGCVAKYDSRNKEGDNREEYNIVLQKEKS